jgi:hypothetical protein
VGGKISDARKYIRADLRKANLKGCSVFFVGEQEKNQEKLF